MHMLDWECQMWIGNFWYLSDNIYNIGVIQYWHHPMYFYNFFQTECNLYNKLFKLLCEIKTAIQFGVSTENMAVTRTKMELNMYQEKGN
jgi:hypothetical protein